MSEDPSFSPERQLALGEIVQNLLGEQRVPGGVVGLWVGGKGEWVHTEGIGDLQTAAPIVADDHFRIASVTKTFVATAVLQQVDAGKLSLDDTLEPFVPGIANGDRITVRQLLGMTGGVFNWIDDPAFEAAYTADPLLDFTPEEEIAIVRGYPADFPPGEKFQYSDTNYVLLGMILEQISGRPVGEVIASDILQPLGMRETSYPDTPEMPEPYAHGYAADPGSAELREISRSNPAVAGAAGAMISTLGDLRIWARALGKGTLLSPETQRERLPTTPVSEVLGFTVGYGLGIMDVNGFYGHNGAIFGYSTWMLHSPVKDATLVVLANRGETQTEFAGRIAADILHLVFPDDFPRAAGVPATPAP